MILTAQNYHSPEAVAEYMTNSQFKSWISCPAKEKAVQAGLWTKKTTEARLVGSYVDRALTAHDEFEAWCKEHSDDIFKTKTDKKTGVVTITGKYAPFEMADKIIARLRVDPFFSEFTAHAKTQVVIEFEINGVKWAVMLDYLLDLNPEEAIINDLKTTASFADQWCVEQVPSDSMTEFITRRTLAPWYDAAGYWRQLALMDYAWRAKTGFTPMCGLIAATKQEFPALGMWVLKNPDRMNREIDRIKLRQPEVMAWKRGEIEAPGCGDADCDFCRSRSSLTPEHIGISKRLWS